MKYAEEFSDWLVQEGYTHCFFVAGGNIMHLLDAARSRFVCVPFVHEVGAGIAAEYFNELALPEGGRAFALVTAGPGLTNIVTAMAGAFLESRELLVIGGQVKSTDLADDGLRQRGIQEIDGIRLVESVCKVALRVTIPVERAVVIEAVREGSRSRKGPVFLEICLDAQGSPALDRVDATPSSATAVTAILEPVRPDLLSAVSDLLLSAERPMILLGGGVSRERAPEVIRELEVLGIPVATTWNAADRVSSSHPLYFGRPNTWGMRWSNVLLQQADLVIAAGTRLGIQQTGFNWEEFAPLASVVHIDVDLAELTKGHPRVSIRLQGDAADTLLEVFARVRSVELPPETERLWVEWRDFATGVRSALPLADPSNTHVLGYVDPFIFVQGLSVHLDANDVIVPCSSGGAFTVAMQALEQQDGQRIATDKGLASMGYGLSGALGAALAHPDRRVILIDGDGGFAQNLQEVGTAAAQQLSVKMFIFCNEGYASIRMTQRNYFDGEYVGCDRATGLGLPQWVKLFDAYGVPTVSLRAADPFDSEVLSLLRAPGPAAFLVPVDPEQTFYPKIASRITDSGGMESSPLHLMHPDLDDDLSLRVFKFLDMGRNG